MFRLYQLNMIIVIVPMQITHSGVSLSLVFNFWVANVILALNQSNLQAAWLWSKSSFYIVSQCPLQKRLQNIDNNMITSFLVQNLFMK